MNPTAESASAAAAAAAVVLCAIAWVPPTSASGAGAERAAITYHVLPVRGERSVEEIRAGLGWESFVEVLRLNRVDARNVAKLDSLVVPDPGRGFRAHSPFPAVVESLAGLPKLLIVSLRVQAFAAYDSGHLARWGPVSTGRAASPTSSGEYHVNWKLPEHRSTVNEEWSLRWCVNIENRVGMALHQYELPGWPASQCCIRLTEPDARWVYSWVDAWRLNEDETEVVESGTPVWIVGAYDFGSLPPWRRLPVDDTADRVRASELGPRLAPGSR